MAPRRTSRLPHAPGAALIVLTGPAKGHYLRLEEEAAIVGRGKDVTLRIDDTGLSRKHARIYRQGGRYYIEDLGSKNGTYMDDRRLTAAHPLADGDRVGLGCQTLVKFALEDSVEAEATQEIHDSALRDALTGAYNRRVLEDRLAAEFAWSARHGAPLSVLMVDVDHFKRVNDTCGHRGGDAVLKIVSMSMLRLVRREDLVARYGGEEFCILARGTGLRNAQIIGERIRRHIEHLSVPLADKKLRVTVSAGVAAYEGGALYSSPDELVAAADHALYAAKEAGRNCVMLARDRPAAEPRVARICPTCGSSRM